MNLNTLTIGKWYKVENILFMPKKKLDTHPHASSFGRYPDGAYDLLYFQSVRHMDFYSYLSGVLYEIHNKEDSTEKIVKQYLYNDDVQSVIWSKEVVFPKSIDFKEVIKAIFELDEESKHWRKK